MLLQGSLAPQHTEVYLQLKTEYLKMVLDQQLAAMVAGPSTRTWLILQEVLFSLGPEMYWSHRRTLLVIRTMELQTAWLDSICLVSLTCPVLQAAVVACMQAHRVSVYLVQCIIQLQLQDVMERVLGVFCACAF